MKYVLMKNNLNVLDELVLVVDNAPCHRRLNEVFENNGAQLL